MLRDLWIVYLSDPDFFIPCMFVCMGISIVLKLYHWRKKWSWTPWLIDQALDAVSSWILICCFVQSQFWLVGNPELKMAIWTSIPYGVFVGSYIFRRRPHKEDLDLSSLKECELVHIHTKLSDFLNSLRYWHGAQEHYAQLFQLEQRIVDEEFRRV